MVARARDIVCRSFYLFLSRITILFFFPGRAATAGSRVLITIHDSNIRQAVEDWFAFQDAATSKYGHIKGWDVSRVTDMSSLFENREDFREDLSSWNTSSVKTVFRMFAGASSFDSDLSNWTVSSVTSMAFTFSQASSFRGRGLSKWETNSLENMDGMFSFAGAFDADLPLWTTNSLQSMDYAFSNALSFNGRISTWSTISLKYMAFAFKNAVSFNQDLKNWDISTSMVDMEGAFWGAQAFNATLCWNVSRHVLSDNLFCGSQGSLDPDCIGEDTLLEINSSCIGSNETNALLKNSTISVGIKTVTAKDSPTNAPTSLSSSEEEPTDSFGGNLQDSSPSSAQFDTSSSNENLDALKYTAMVISFTAVALIVSLGMFVAWKRWRFLKDERDVEDGCTVIETASRDSSV